MPSLGTHNESYTVVAAPRVTNTVDWDAPLGKLHGGSSGLGGAENQGEEGEKGMRISGSRSQGRNV